VPTRPRAAGGVRVSGQRATAASGGAGVGAGAAFPAVCVAGVATVVDAQHASTTTGVLTTVVQPQLVWQ
jgi:hypothetical protein